jgi:hypothetical protein
MRYVRRFPDVLTALSGVKLNWSEPVIDVDLDRYVMTGANQDGKEVVCVLYGIVDEPNGPRVAANATARVLTDDGTFVELDIEHTGPTSVEVRLSEEPFIFCSP